MTKEWISLSVFVLCYVLFVFLPGKRSWVACAGGALLIATGVLTKALPAGPSLLLLPMPAARYPRLTTRSAFTAPRGTPASPGPAWTSWM